MRFIHPKYFFSPKFSPKSRCGLYANAGYTPLSTVLKYFIGGWIHPGLIRFSQENDVVDMLYTELYYIRFCISFKG